MKILIVFTLLLCSTSFTYGIPHIYDLYKKSRILTGQSHNSYETQNTAMNSINDILNSDGYNYGIGSNTYASSQDFNNIINEASDIDSEIRFSGEPDGFNDGTKNSFKSKGGYDSNFGLIGTNGIGNTHSRTREHTHSKDTRTNSVRTPVPKTYPVPAVRTLQVHIPHLYPIPVTKTIEIPVFHPYTVPIAITYPVQVPKVIPVSVRSPVYIRVPYPIKISVPQSYPVRIPVPVQVSIDTHGHSRTDGMQNHIRDRHDLIGGGHNFPKGKSFSRS